MAGGLLIAGAAFLTYRSTPAGRRARLARVEVRIADLESELQGYSSEMSESRLALERFLESLPGGVLADDDLTSVRVARDYRYAIADAELSHAETKARADRLVAERDRLRRSLAAQADPLLDR